MTTKSVIWTTIALFLLGVVLWWVWWAVSVATSGPKGQGDAIKTKNSAQNWTAAQAKFEELHQGIQAADKKTGLAAQRAGDPGIFFFTTDDVMVETSLDYIQSDQPLAIDVPRLRK